MVINGANTQVGWHCCFTQYVYLLPLSKRVLRRSGCAGLGLLTRFLVPFSLTAVDLVSRGGGGVSRDMAELLLRPVSLSLPCFLCTEQITDE